MAKKYVLVIYDRPSGGLKTIGTFPSEADAEYRAASMAAHSGENLRVEITELVEAFPHV